jgi:hypothetical protein
MTGVRFMSHHQHMSPTGVPSDDLWRLDGRVAPVTGASAGLGALGGSRSRSSEGRAVVRNVLTTQVVRGSCALEPQSKQGSDYAESCVGD